MKLKQLIVPLVLAILLIPTVALAHGGVEFHFSVLEKTGPRTLEYAGHYETSVVHPEVHISVCLWHKNAGGWHVHVESCKGGQVNNAVGIRTPGNQQVYWQQTVVCPDADGPWKSRTRGWVKGSNGTVHLDKTIDSFQKTISC